MGKGRVRERSSHWALVVFALIAIVQAVTARPMTPRDARADDARWLEPPGSLLLSELQLME